MKGGDPIPDWCTHTLIGWMTGKTIKMNLSLVVIGSLVPDLVKITIVFNWLDINHQNLFIPFHTPIGAILIIGIIALLFENFKIAFFPLGIGISTHFILDFFLVHISGGMKLLFPFSWDEWQFYLIHSDDYRITIIAFVAALLIYLIYFYLEKRNTKKNKES